MPQGQNVSTSEQVGQKQGEGQAPNPNSAEGQALEAKPGQTPSEGQAPQTSMSLEDAMSAIKELRAENAKHRTSNKELGEKYGKMEAGLKNLFGEQGNESLTVEERIEALEQEKRENARALEAQQTEAALVELAYELDIPKEEREYFDFLVGKELNGLEDGEELTDGKLEEIAAKVKRKSAPSSTSTTGLNTPPPSQGGKAITLKDFQAMSLTEKSKLYTSDKTTYQSLYAQARSEGKIK